MWKIGEKGRNIEQWRLLNRFIRLSYKEHQVDALALGAEEGRDKLRKAAESCK